MRWIFGIVDDASGCEPLRVFGNIYCLIGWLIVVLRIVNTNYRSIRSINRGINRSEYISYISAYKNISISSTETKEKLSYLDSGNIHGLHVTCILLRYKATALIALLEFSYLSTYQTTYSLQFPYEEALLLPLRSLYIPLSLNTTQTDSKLIHT